MKIGVFDSGIGGESVAIAIRHALPQAQVIAKSDHQHMPYGDKSPQEVLGYVLPILQGLVAQGCQVIVIACNTVTTTLIIELRKQIFVPLVGIEPMVKTAAEITRTGTVAVCATPATLASKRYAWLKDTYAQQIEVLEPDCSKWAYMIEHNQINQQQLQRQMDEVCAAGADVVVLGCTHYHWIQKMIKHMVAGRAQVIQPEEAVVRRLKAVLAQHS